jgi:hypothetical protein
VNLAAPPADPDAARRAARDIVHSRGYRAESVPRPLEGVLRWIGDRLRPIGDALQAVADFLSHGVGLVLLIGIVAALAVALGVFLVRRAATPASGAARAEARGSVADDPEALERAAGDAERAGDLDRAVRLRFRAGLLRLDRAGAIRFVPSLTSGQVTRAVRVTELAALAATFEGIAYGGRRAGAPDVDAARTGWPRVVDAAARR